MQQIVDEHLLDFPIVTAHLLNCDVPADESSEEAADEQNAHICDNGGTLTFGGLDFEHCGPVGGEAANRNARLDCLQVSQWISLTEDSPYWQFKIDSIGIGKASIKSGLFNQAISDTGENSRWPIVRSHLFKERLT